MRHDRRCEGGSENAQILPPIQIPHRALQTASQHIKIQQLKQRVSIERLKKLSDVSILRALQSPFVGQCIRQAYASLSALVLLNTSSVQDLLFKMLSFPYTNSCYLIILLVGRRGLTVVFAAIPMLDQNTVRFWTLKSGSKY